MNQNLDTGHPRWHRPHRNRPTDHSLSARAGAATRSPRRTARGLREGSERRLDSARLCRCTSSAGRSGGRATQSVGAEAEQRSRSGRTWSSRSADSPPVALPRSNHRGCARPAEPTRVDEEAARSRAAGPWSRLRATISARAVRRARKYPAERPRPGGGFGSVRLSCSVLGVHSILGVHPADSEQAGGGFLNPLTVSAGSDPNSNKNQPAEEDGNR
jgi:hypothetical protein